MKCVLFKLIRYKKKTGGNHPPVARHCLHIHMMWHWVYGLAQRSSTESYVPQKKHPFLWMSAVEHGWLANGAGL